MAPVNRVFVKVTAWPEDSDRHVKKLLPDADVDTLRETVATTPYYQLLSTAQAVKFSAAFTLDGGKAALEAPRVVQVYAWGDHGKAQTCLDIVTDDAERVAAALRWDFDEGPWTTGTIPIRTAAQFRTCVQAAGGRASIQILSMDAMLEARAAIKKLLNR